MTTIMLENLLLLLGVFCAYTALFVLIPFWTRGFSLSGENVLERLVSSFLFAHVVITLEVLLLALAGILYPATLIAALLVTIWIYRAIAGRRNPDRLTWRQRDAMIEAVLEGYYHPVLLLKKIGARIWKEFSFIKFNRKTAIGTVSTLIIFAIVAYIRCYPAVSSMPFTTTTTIDVYTHMEWIKYLLHNTPFYNGVYPFGFHTAVAAVASCFGFNAVSVVRMFGALGAMMIFFSLYFILRRTMKSAFAVNTALLLYAATNLFYNRATIRQIMALPQEYATIFLYLTAFFLFKYMKDRKKTDLFTFAAAVSLLISTHFYIAIFAAIFCFFIFLFCFFYWKGGVILRIIAAALAALLISVAPFAIGLAMGIRLEPSMEWAVSYLGDPTGGATPEVSADIAGVDGADITAPAAPTTETSNLPERLSLSGYLQKAQKYFASEAGSIWFDPALVFLSILSAAIALVCPIFFGKKRRHMMLYCAFSAYVGAFAVLYFSAIFQVFALTESFRIYMYLMYALPLVLAVPLELIHELLCTKFAATRRLYLVLVSIVTIFGTTHIITQNRLTKPAPTYQMQYDGALISYYKIVNTMPHNKWILVSSVFEYPLCLFEGYHYELVDFYKELSEHKNGDPFYLPAENIFIFVEKRPVMWYEPRAQMPQFDEEDLQLDLMAAYDAVPANQHSILYRNYTTNRALHAKVYSWAMEYIQFFPKEMKIFHEDDEMIIFHLEQNTYALNNLAIPFPEGQEA